MFIRRQISQVPHGNMVTIVIFLFFLVTHASCEQTNSLTFLIDNTSSMHTELSQIKEAAKSIVDTRIVTNEEPCHIEDIVLVTFNDPSVEFRKRTRNVLELKQSLDEITVHGGGMCPKPCLAGIKLALQESQAGSYLYVFTDASAKDYAMLEEIVSMCQEKKIQIVLVITGLCQSERDPGYQVYHKIAAACNGQVFRITEGEVKEVISYVKETIKGHLTVITSQTVESNDSFYNVVFNVDDETKYIMVSVAGKHASVTILDPLGRPITAEYDKITWTKNVKVLKLSHLPPRTYLAQVRGSAQVNVKVIGRTDFTFDYGFSDNTTSSLIFTEPQPFIGASSHLIIYVKDKENSVVAQTVEILDMEETVMKALSMTNMGGQVYATEVFTPPENMFKIAITARGRSTGNPLRRIANTPVAAIRAVIVAPQISDSEKNISIIEGSPVAIHCRILKGKPKPHVTWFYKPPSSSTYTLLRNRTDMVFRTTNATLNDTGRYKCVAENSGGRVEHDVQLQVRVPPRIMFSPPNEPKYRGVEGDVLMKLSCIAEGHPKPIISWTIDNNTIGTDKLEQSYVEDGSLFVKSPMTANSNNTYACSAHNDFGHDYQIYEVLVSEYEDYDNPAKMYGEVGKPYEINCSLPFTDPNSVRWFYNSVYLNVTGASIRWKNASQANDGNYTCRVSDPSGAASVTVELTFGLPPTPSNSTTEWDVEWDDNLDIACVVDMDSSGKYEWYYNGEKIEDADEKWLSVFKFGFGTYTCRASNSWGSLDLTYNISSQDCVIDKSLSKEKHMPIILDNSFEWPTFSSNQKFIVVPQSEKLNLVCQVEPPLSESVEPHSNRFRKVPGTRSTVATCVHEDIFLIDGESYKISELDCIQPVMPSARRAGQCLGYRTEMVDVGFYFYSFIRVYSSCLDIDRNLLLYTFVSMKGLDKLWKVNEPERPCKQVDDCCYETIELVTAEDVGFGAAESITLTYRTEQLNSVLYCRPSEDTESADRSSRQHATEMPITTTESRIEPAETSSSPNAASTTEPPSQEPETSWHDIERQVRNGPRNVTVWSGAGNYTQVGDMMVPQYLWKVVLDCDSEKYVAIVHSNAHAPVAKLCADDCRSPSVLALFEHHGVRTYCCSLDEFNTAFEQHNIDTESYWSPIY